MCFVSFPLVVLDNDLKSDHTWIKVDGQIGSWCSLCVPIVDMEWHSQEIVQIYCCVLVDSRPRFLLSSGLTLEMVAP